MKKLLAVLSSIIIVFGVASVSFADENLLISTWNDTNDTVIAYDEEAYIPSTISVKNNDEYIDFTDAEGNVVEPQIINDRTMVPFRKIFNALGVADENISWNGDTKTVVAKKDNIEIELQINNEVAKKTVSGDISQIKLDSVPVIVDGRTLVPVRFIAESMNKKVGWDGTNRTVIIIDTQDLINDLERSIPKFVEIANSNVVMPETFGMNMKLTGKLEYTDKQNKSNNTTINLNGTINMKKGTAMIELDANANLTGKGEIYDTINSQGFGKFDINMIAGDNKIYLKSSLLDSQTEGKWIFTEDESINQAISLLNENNYSINTIFDVKEEDLSIYTYESLEVVASMLKTICKDDNIKITEKGSKKTYTYNFDLKDILEMTGSVDGITGNVKSTATYENNVAKTSVAEMKLGYKYGTESLSLELKLDGKVSDENITITAPNESQVISADALGN